MKEIICFKCNEKFQQIKAILLHFKITHQLILGNILICRQTAFCQRKFHSFSTFKKHLISKHNINNDLMLSNKYKRTRIGSNFLENDSSFNCENRECSPDSDLNAIINFDREILNSKIQNLIAQFCSKLYANPSIPRNQVQFIIDNVNVLLREGFGSILRKMFKKQKNCTQFDIQNIINLLENSFENLDTEKKRLKFFEKTEYWIPPTSYYVGNYTSNKNVGNSSIYHIENATAHFIPLRII